MGPGRYLPRNHTAPGLVSPRPAPGPAMPKLPLAKETTNHLNRDFDPVHLGACMVKAVNTAACLINLDTLESMIKNVRGKEVVIGTHTC